MPRLKKKKICHPADNLRCSEIKVRPLCSAVNCFFRGAATGDGGGETRAVWQRWETSRLNAHRMWRNSLWKPCLEQNVCVYVYVCVCVCVLETEKGRETWAHSQWSTTCAEHVRRSVRASQLFDSRPVGPYIKPDTYIKHFTPSSAAAAAFR